MVYLKIAANLSCPYLCYVMYLLCFRTHVYLVYKHASSIYYSTALLILSIGGLEIASAVVGFGTMMFLP